MICHTLTALLAVLRRQWQHHRSRQQLRDLDSRLLDDIGIDRHEAEREARKPFWKP